jgi:hypothetical protein
MLKVLEQNHIGNHIRNHIGNHTRVKVLKRKRTPP